MTHKNKKLLTQVFTWALFFIIVLESCGQKNNSITPSSLLGKWTAQKVEGKHFYNDFSEAMSATMPQEGDYIMFEQEMSGSSGKFSTVQYGMNESGTWEYDEKEQLLTITYTSFEPHFIIFRKVDKATKDELVLTEDDELIKKWVAVNHIMEDSPKKIVGGNLYESYIKSQ
ncbi:MAG: hypothetical protein KDC49_05760 [Saprospiraceae bacterium]|nr:hypothetical protein [Saprospiraceae bacterium]